MTSLQTTIVSPATDGDWRKLVRVRKDPNVFHFASVAPGHPDERIGYADVRMTHGAARELRDFLNEAYHDAPAAPVEKARPHGPQEYKGNGNHDWEMVTGTIIRLRVPGGWLYGERMVGAVGYELAGAPVFVPMPEVVNYPI